MSTGFRSLFLLSFAMVVGVMGTALISPLYGLYQEAWHLQTVEVSLIYVVYMGGALSALLFFGRLPDVLGFKVTLAWALGAIWVGTLVSMLAWNTVSLSVGRFIVGAASSMITTSASLGFLHVAPPEKRIRMAMLSSILMAFGFGVGPLVGGILGQWAPWPLVTTYLPTLVLALLGIAGLRKVQVHPHDGAAAQRRAARWADIVPKLTWPAREDTGALVLTCALPFVAFGVFGLYASMLPLFLDKMIPWHGPMVSGTALALLLFGSSGALVRLRRIDGACRQQCHAAGQFAGRLHAAVLQWCVVDRPGARPVHAGGHDHGQQDRHAGQPLGPAGDLPRGGLRRLHGAHAGHWLDCGPVGHERGAGVLLRRRGGDGLRGGLALQGASAHGRLSDRGGKL
jgi:MFS family permease